MASGSERCLITLVGESSHFTMQTSNSLQHLNGYFANTSLAVQKLNLKTYNQSAQGGVGSWTSVPCSFSWTAHVLLRIDGSVALHKSGSLQQQCCAYHWLLNQPGNRSRGNPSLAANKPNEWTFAKSAWAQAHGPSNEALHSTVSKNCWGEWQSQPF